jgi:hypothetical protein
VKVSVGEAVQCDQLDAGVAEHGAPARATLRIEQSAHRRFREPHAACSRRETAACTDTRDARAQRALDGFELFAGMNVRAVGEL